MFIAQICMVTLSNTIIYRAHPFQEFIEKPREFIYIYGKYDYFHFCAFLESIRAVPLFEIIEPE